MDYIDGQRNCVSASVNSILCIPCNCRFVLLHATAPWWLGQKWVYIFHTWSLHSSCINLSVLILGISIQTAQQQLQKENFHSLSNHSYRSTPRTALGPTQPPIQWVPGALSLGVKWLGREADHSPPSSSEVTEWVELYLHSPNTP
jgi:hypothetical protein